MCDSVNYCKADFVKGVNVDIFNRILKKMFFNFDSEYFPIS